MSKVEPRQKQRQRSAIRQLLVGGLNPSEKYLVNWDDYSQYMGKYKMFQTTNQINLTLQTWIAGKSIEPQVSISTVMARKNKIVTPVTKLIYHEICINHQYIEWLLSDINNYYYGCI